MNPRSHEMGDFTRVATLPPDEIIRQVYKAHNPVIAQAIIEHFKDKNTLECAEFGGGPGVFAQDIANLIKGKQLLFTNIDKSEDLLSQDNFSQFKIRSNLADVKQSDVKKVFDVVLMRYVLNYNDLATQLQILKNVYKFLKPDGIFILQHCGGSNEMHRDKFNTLFLSDIVSSKLIRPGAYWSTPKEVKELLDQSGFTGEVLEQYSIPVGNLYKERYELTEAETEKLQSYLGEYNYVEYTIYSCTKNAQSLL